MLKMVTGTGSSKEIFYNLSSFKEVYLLFKLAVPARHARLDLASSCIVHKILDFPIKS